MPAIRDAHWVMLMTCVTHSIRTADTQQEGKSGYEAPYPDGQASRLVHLPISSMHMHFFVLGLWGQ